MATRRPTQASGLLSQRQRRTKTIIAPRRCELVSIAAPTFLRMVAKSTAIKHMMEQDKAPLAAWAEKAAAEPPKKRRSWFGR